MEDHETLQKSYKEIKVTIMQLAQEMDENKTFQILKEEKFFSKIVKYTMAYWKPFRAFICLYAYKEFEKRDNLTEENLNLVRVAAALLEMVIYAHLIIDDIVDKSRTRAGVTSWHIHQKVGVFAVYDSLVLMHGVKYILKKYFSTKPYYNDLVDEFDREASYVDLANKIDCQMKKTDDLSYITEKNLMIIRDYKGGLIGFQQPMKVAMYIAGIADPKIHNTIDDLFIPHGRYLHFQDEVWDCYGKSAETGTDIKEGKCTFLILKALELAAPEDKTLLRMNYGVDTEESEQCVKAIYDKLNIRHLCYLQEKLLLNEILELHKQLPDSLPRAPFNLIEKMIISKHFW